MTRSHFGGLVQKEIFHILRDRKTLAVVILLPIVQVLLFGYAIRTDVQQIRLAVVDPAPDFRALAVRDRFAASPTYRIVSVHRSPARLSSMFERGAADQAIIFESGFAGELYSAAGAGLLLVTDGTSPIMSGAFESHARGVLQSHRRSLVAEVGGGGSAYQGVQIDTRVRHRFNPSLESRLLFVPGLLALVLTIISALMTAITLSREKETGTLEVLLASPLRPIHIILGKALPYLVLAFINAVTTLAVAWSVFRVPVRGSLVLLFGESLLFVAVCLALGIVIATRLPSQRAAMIGVIVGTMLPTAILSGMIFPIESMPEWLQPITHVVPAKWYVNVVRGIMLKGATLETLWQETIVLIGMAAVLLAVSVRSFSPRLD